MTVVAFPLIAIQSFHASTFEVGVLTAAGYLPYLLFGLPAGVWVDRVELKSALVACDLARVLLLAAVPVLYACQLLTLPVLCGISFMMGFFTLVFDIGDHSFLPQIAESENEIIEGNTKLHLTASGSHLVGPALGGALVHAVTAPFALVADCLSYLASGILLGGVRIQRAKDRRSPAALSPPISEEIRVGLEFLRRNEYLRPLAISMAIANFFDLFGIIQAVLAIYVTRELGMSAWELGAVLAISNLGALIGSAVNSKCVARIGIGSSIVISGFVPGAALLLLPFATAGHGLLSVGLPLLVANIGLAIFNINQISLRQHITPVNLLGRMNATIRFFIWGSMPLGAFVGGVLGEEIGVRPTLMIAAVGSLCAGVVVATSRIRGLATMPAKASEEAAL